MQRKLLLIICFALMVKALSAQVQISKIVDSIYFPNEFYINSNVISERNVVNYVRPLELDKFLLLDSTSKRLQVVIHQSEYTFYKSLRRPWLFPRENGLLSFIKKYDEFYLRIIVASISQEEIILLAKVGRVNYYSFKNGKFNLINLSTTKVFLEYNHAGLLVINKVEDI